MLRSPGFAVGVAGFLSGVGSARAAPADLQFNQVVNDFVFGTLRLAPAAASAIGYHRDHGVVFEDMLDDYSASARWMRNP